MTYVYIDMYIYIYGMYITHRDQVTRTIFSLYRALTVPFLEVVFKVNRQEFSRCSRQARFHQQKSGWCRRG